MATREEQESRGTTTVVKDQGQQLATEAQERVAKGAEEARNEASARLREQVERQSTTAGEHVHALGTALRRSAETLRSEGKDLPANVVEQTATRAESLGAYLRDANADRIIRDVESFARRRPWLTGAAGLVAGFAASRFLKASSQRRYESVRSQYGVPRDDGRELSAGGPR